MKLLQFISIAASLMLSAGLYGCGGGNSGEVSPGTTSTYEASKSCFDCHAGSNAPAITYATVVEEWKVSNHNTAKSGALYGASCSDCHEPQTGHPNACGRCHGGVPSASNVIGSDVIRNPDFEQKCYKCHHARSLSAGHFSLYTSANGPGSFVSRNFEKKCIACHNPHDVTTLMELNKDWAKSGHGNPNGVAWKYYDFKSQNRAACTRCHTTTGFVNFVTGATTAFPATNWGSATDKTKEVLSCSACHESYDFKNSARKVAPFKAPYGGTTASPNGVALQYPDAGESNMCIPCHAARENGKSMVLGIATFDNAGFKNPHYLAAAAVFYGMGGFQYYSSASQTPYYAQAYTSKYGVIVDGTVVKAAAATSTVPKISVGDSLVGKKAPWNHGKLGMNNFITSTGASSANIGTNKDPAGKIWNSGDKGQCVACHLGPKNTHTFNAFESAKATWGTNSTSAMGCYGCHSGEDMEEVADNSEKILFNRVMAFFQWQMEFQGQLTRKLFYVDATNPYFFTTPYDPNYKESGACSSNLPLKNWQVGGTSTFTWNATKKSCDSAVASSGTAGSGPGFMGAAMNLKLLNAEKGAHVHNRTYMKQLIFDSIQFLQKGTVNFSNRNIASGVTDVNNLISFTNYSTYLKSNPDNIINTTESAAQSTNAGVPGAGVVGQPVSISQLKRYITRYNTAAPNLNLFTRP